MNDLDRLQQGVDELVNKLGVMSSVVDGLREREVLVAADVAALWVSVEALKRVRITDLEGFTKLYHQVEALESWQKTFIASCVRYEKQISQLDTNLYKLALETAARAVEPVDNSQCECSHHALDHEWSEENERRERCAVKGCDCDLCVPAARAVDPVDDPTVNRCTCGHHQMAHDLETTECRGVDVDSVPCDCGKFVPKTPTAQATERQVIDAVNAQDSPPAQASDEGVEKNHGFEIYPGVCSSCGHRHGKHGCWEADRDYAEICDCKEFAPTLSGAADDRAMFKWLAHYLATRPGSASSSLGHYSIRLAELGNGAPVGVTHER